MPAGPIDEKRRVCAGRDLDAAASGAISGIFAAPAGSRLLVQNSIREPFTKKVAALGASARKGDPILAETNIGPVTTRPQYNKILEYIDIAKAEGARCILEGEGRPTCPAASSSNPLSSST